MYYFYLVIYINICVISGNLSTVKIHITIALVIKVCSNNYRILFIVIHILLKQIKEAKCEKLLRQLEYNLISMI
ncbi:hypothetical protein E0494_02940 [Marinilabiliaceae bacterium JC040]|nr:hypothetical protein [Marinilabiliaceae bacterium JC040]